MINPEKIRDQFPIFENQTNKTPVVYLDTAASAQKPACVLDSMDQIMRTYYANVHRGLYDYSLRSTLAFEKARQNVAQFIGASSGQEVLFVKNMTEGMNLIAQTFGKMITQTKKRILLSEMEHHSNLVPWMMLAKQFNLTIDYIPMHSDSGTLDLEALSQKLADDVALVSVVHVSNVLGTINPIKEISKRTQKHGVSLIVDGAQAVHHLPVNVGELGCDFYVFTGHKMYGPTGVGVVWGKHEHLKNMPAYHGGGEMVESVTYKGFITKQAPAKFEAGTPNIVGVVGLSSAIEFIQSVGFETIVSYENKLSEYLMDGLLQNPKIKLLPRSKDAIGVFSFTVDGCHAHDIATLLDQQGVAVRVGFHCAQPLHEKLGLTGSIRASIGMYNNQEDLTSFTKALNKAIEMVE